METSQYPAVMAAHRVDQRNRIVSGSRLAATLVEQAADSLPEIISIGVTAEGITIQPWLPGAPVTAMRAFEALMEGPIERRAYPNLMPDSDVCALAIVGTISGVKVTVTATTYHRAPVDGLLGVTEQALAEIARLERPYYMTGPDEVILAETIESDPEVIHDEPRAVDPADPEPARPSDDGPESPPEG